MFGFVENDDSDYEQANMFVGRSVQEARATKGDDRGIEINSNRKILNRYVEELGVMKTPSESLKNFKF